MAGVSWPVVAVLCPGAEAEEEAFSVNSDSVIVDRTRGARYEFAACVRELETEARAQPRVEQSLFDDGARREVVVAQGPAASRRPEVLKAVLGLAARRRSNGSGGTVRALEIYQGKVFDLLSDRRLAGRERRHLATAATAPLSSIAEIWALAQSRRRRRPVGETRRVEVASHVVYVVSDSRGSATTLVDPLGESAHTAREVEAQRNGTLFATRYREDRRVEAERETDVVALRRVLSLARAGRLDRAFTVSRSSTLTYILRDVLLDDAASRSVLLIASADVAFARLTARALAFFARPAVRHHECGGGSVVEPDSVVLSRPQPGTQGGVCVRAENTEDDRDLRRVVDVCLENATLDASPYAPTLRHAQLPLCHLADLDYCLSSLSSCSGDSEAPRCASPAVVTPDNPSPYTSGGHIRAFARI